VNHIVRSLASTIENARVEAERHQHHIKYLKKRFLEYGGRPLNDIDIQSFMLEAGDDPVFEVPDDSLMFSSGLSSNRMLSEQSLSSSDMDL
jgi:hypothetical protein